MSFGQIVRQAREARGLRQQDLAHILGCTDSYITLIEAGRRVPSDDLIDSLLKALQLAPEEQAQFQSEIESARQQQTTKRLQARGNVINNALRSIGARDSDINAMDWMLTPSDEVDDLAKELKQDQTLMNLWRQLRVAYSNEELRTAVLVTLAAWEKATIKSDKA